MLAYEPREHQRQGEHKERGRAQGIAPTMDEEEADACMVAKERFFIQIESRTVEFA
jgi:hypothetical protein